MTLIGNSIRDIQRGFTLIELMIVVAIIGVVASIAIPQYQNYTTRAQVAETINLLSSLRSDLGEFYALNGRFPVHNIDNDFTARLANYQIGNVTDLSLNNFPGSPYNAANNPAITLIAVLDQAAISNLTGSSNQLVFIADARSGGALQWVCLPRDVSGVEERYLPASCRGRYSDF